MKKILALAAAATLAGCVVVPGGGFPNPNGPPTYGTATVNPGFTRTVQVQAGGSIPAASVGNCRGYVASNPDFNVQFNTLFGLLPLAISVNAATDTTLLVQTPSGQWLCDDDSGGNLNPRIQINSPVAGVYKVWVGNYSGAPGFFPPAMLRFN
ncbi:MAG: peptidase S1 [Bauldia sp.]|nr:peptidase S1 [Bauldia sp.]